MSSYVYVCRVWGWCVCQWSGRDLWDVLCRLLSPTTEHHQHTGDHCWHLCTSCSTVFIYRCHSCCERDYIFAIIIQFNMQEVSNNYSIWFDIVLQLYYVHKRKMFFDESWIISYDRLQHRGPNHAHSKNSGGRHMSLEPTRKLSIDSTNARTLYDFNISPTTFTDIGIQ